MKKKATFDVTVGSYWPSERNESWIGAFELPKGGEWNILELEFETDGKDLYADATKELEKIMKDTGKSYHIWYWFFYD